MIRRNILAVVCLGFACQARAEVLTFFFDELQDGEEVLNYYNGGFGSLGTGPGPQLGVTFAGALVTLPLSAGGSGLFDAAPSAPGALFTEGIATIQAPFGAGGRLSFWYLNPGATTSLRLIDADGEGLWLANLNPTPGEPGQPYGVFRQVSFDLPAGGVALTFSPRGLGGVYIDDFSFSALETPIPEPGVWWASALLMSGAWLTRRRV